MQTVVENHVYRKPSCPFGKKAVDLLTARGIDYEDHIFASDAEAEAFKKDHAVQTTPQIFFGEERVGGYTDLAARLGEATKAEETSYLPVIAVFSVTALLALATGTGLMGFMGFSLSVLACLKLMDLAGFAQSFAKYDLLTKVFPPYGKIYPFAELAAGLGFLSGSAPTLTGGVALFVGIIGAISIVKAVYIDKRDLNCACIGGNSKAPLGLVSFTENAMMAGMGLWLFL